MQLFLLAANSSSLEATEGIAILWHLWKSLTWLPKKFVPVPPFLMQSGGQRLQSG